MGLSLEFRIHSVSPLPLGGFSLNFGQMFTCGTMCRTHNSAMGTQGQGHSSRSWVRALNFVSTRYLFYPWKDFFFNFGQMFASVKWCAEPVAQPCRLTRSQLKVTSLSLETGVGSVSPLLLEGFSLNVGQMFASVRWCRTHNSAMLTQGQGHNWRSPVWALNSEAAPLPFRLPC